ncbi:kinase-like domain-containing protein [Gorgonomyces haynaldii]|nr:kinase-like domain-containing protein [Gorgonomyces haynaldii]
MANSITKKLSTSQQNNLFQFLSSPHLISVGSYTLGRTIGEGTFGKVKLGTHQLTGQSVAIKIVDKMHAPSLVREIETWRQLRHPNVAHLYDVLCTETKIYMVTEYCPGGEVFEYISKNGKMGESELSRGICRQIVEAVGHCHDKGLTHRDLKLENIVFTSEQEVKLIDFGFTTSFEQSPLLETYCGSSAYASPEIISGKKYSGRETDCWSLGVIIYTIVVGVLPFDDDNDSVIHKKILDVDFAIPQENSLVFQDLINNLLVFEPSKRLTIPQILEHPFIKSDDKKQERKPEQLYTKEELIVASKLESLGLDTKSILESANRNACDSKAALWHLLLELETKKPSKIHKNAEGAHFVTCQLDTKLMNQKKQPQSENPLLEISRIAASADSHTPIGATEVVQKPKQVTVESTSRRNIFKEIMKGPQEEQDQKARRRPKSASARMSKTAEITEEEEF